MRLCSSAKEGKLKRAMAAATPPPEADAPRASYRLPSLRTAALATMLAAKVPRTEQIRQKIEADIRGIELPPEHATLDDKATR